MKTTIRGRHLEVTEAIKSYAEKRFEKLETYFSHLEETEVVLKHDDGKEYSVEVIVAVKGHKYVVKTKGEELYSEIDKAKEKIKTVLRKEHQKAVEVKR
jgi:putative sigma-54 modulation protein